MDTDMRHFVAHIGSAILSREPEGIKRRLTSLHGLTDPCFTSDKPFRLRMKVNFRSDSSATILGSIKIEPGSDDSSPCVVAAWHILDIAFPYQAP